jgi:pyruvate dehydrogenase E2 component (dihydrolipoamide acetyltransferase)
MPSVELHKYSRPSMWRKMAQVNWRPPGDPQIYARTDVEMTNALAYMESEGERHGVNITPSVLAIRAVALGYRKNPDANALVRWRRVYRRKRIHIFCNVAIPGKNPDLSGVLVRDAEGKTPAAIALELSEAVRRARRGEDKELARTRRVLDRIPNALYRPVLGAIGFLQYTLNVNLSFLGLPQDPFGGALVTSVGFLGMSEGFAPLSPITRAPLVLSVGRVEDRPMAVEGRVEVRPMLSLCATLDHRVLDGLAAGKLAKSVVRYLADPAGRERAEAERQAVGDERPGKG